MSDLHLHEEIRTLRTIAESRKRENVELKKKYDAEIERLKKELGIASEGLTIAYMKGVEDGKQKFRQRIAELENQDE